METELLVAAIGVVGSVSGWVVKKSSDLANTINDHDKRIALTEQAFEDLKVLINSRFDASDQRTSRIERSLNGHLHRD